MMRFTLATCFAPLLVTLGVAGCTEALLGPGAENTPHENFEVLWRDFDELYSHFDIKDVDWEEAKTRYRNQVTSSTTDEELVDILGAMLRELNDGHVFLRTPDTTIYSDVARRTEPNYYDPDLVEQRYVSGSLTTIGDGRIHYGRISDFGYVRITDFADRGGMLSAVGAWAHDFDHALTELRDVEALVIDVRGNLGGSFFNGRFMAGRLTDEPRLVSLSQFRNGPDHDQFTELEPWSVVPRGPWTWHEPVVVLIDRRVASAAEWFTLAMRQMPHVTLVGTSTAGVVGSRIRRELPNGWTFGLPVQRVYTPEMEILEGVGIAPDVFVGPAPEDVAEERDRILERALKILTRRTSQGAA